MDDSKPKRARIDWTVVPVIPLRYPRCPTCGRRNTKPVKTPRARSEGVTVQRRLCDCGTAWLNVID